MRMPRAFLEGFVERFFRHRDRFLRALEGTGSPAYLLDPETLRERGARFRRTFEAPLGPCSFYYALKCNHHPRVVRILLEEGYGLDVSSGRELELARSLGAKDLIFSGPGKTRAELDLATERPGEPRVLLDSFGELLRLEEAAARRGLEIPSGVRLSTDPSGLWGKFGIPPEDLPRFLREARNCPHVALRGLQVHTSWNLSPQAPCAFLARLGPILAALPREDREALDFLDLGGGFWPESGEWLREEGPDPSPLEHRLLPAAPLEEHAEALREALDRHLGPHRPRRLCFEPGRWIVQDALHLLLTVVDRKAPDLAILDGGINLVGWDRFETDYAPVLNLTRPSRTERPCRLLGSLCTPQDVFGFSYFGEDLLPGDVLLIPSQGAYTFSLAQEFIKPLPPVGELAPLRP